MSYTSEYPPFSVTVDIILLTIRGGDLCALAVRRGQPPHQGKWALPGGFVEEDEDLVHAAKRELHEETGLDTGDVVLEQVGAFGAPGRDPRGRVVSVAWLAVLPDGVDPTAGSDASDASWKPVDYLRARRRLAFDHAEILGRAVERARVKLENTGLAAQFLGEVFTIGELRRVYEVMWDVALDPGNFHRKVTRTGGFVEPTGRVVAGARGRPAELFRYAGADVPHPSLTRGGLG